ncbi:MAG: hypothetical protein ACKV2V_15615 [Blastocatellia bacterium]
MPNKTIATRIFILALLACACLSVSVVAQRSAPRAERRSSHEEWTMTMDDNGRGLQVRIRGRVEFNDDYSDLRTLSPGGSLRVRDTRTGTTRPLDIEADGHGNLTRGYFVNDRARELDAEARQWMAALMPELVRQSGFDAERRVARAVARSGAQSKQRRDQQAVARSGSRSWV